MPKLNETFGSSFLKAEDLPSNKNVTVTIAEVEEKEFDDGKKLLIRFKGKDKALVCNRTNATIIAEVLKSDDTDDWLGRSVSLCVKKVEFSGRLVPAIRVSLDAPKSEQARQASAKPAPSDNEGFDGEDSVGF